MTSDIKRTGRLWVEVFSAYCRSRQQFDKNSCHYTPLIVTARGTNVGCWHFLLSLYVRNLFCYSPHVISLSICMICTVSIAWHIEISKPLLGKTKFYGNAGVRMT
jgi:hypothetical protein